MLFSRLLAEAVDARLDEKRAATIATRLIEEAQEGNLEALKVVIGYSAMAKQIHTPAQTEKCTHPPELREEFPTMGSGPAKTRCACGASFIGDKEI